MARFEKLFVKGNDLYAKFRWTYPPEMYQKILDSVSTGRELAVDVATGTGQVAQALAPHFEKVIAQDVSQEQISSAIQISNVVYKVGKAENLIEEAELEEKSVDLITAACALHWFDKERFYNQVKRVLKPKGVFAALGYSKFTFPENPTASAIIKEFDQGVLGPYWEEPVAFVRSKYESLRPYGLFENVEFWSSESVIQTNLHRLKGFISTWTAYKAFRKENPEADPLISFENDLKKALNVENDRQSIDICNEFFGFIAKNPIQD